MLFLLKMLAERIFWPFLFMSEYAASDYYDDTHGTSIFAAIFGALGTLAFIAVPMLFVFVPKEVLAYWVPVPFLTLVILGYLADRLAIRIWGLHFFRRRLFH